jgi:hypothetical protein
VKTETYYVVRIQITRHCYEYLSHRERDYPTYGGRAIPAEWFRTDIAQDAYQFDSQGRAAKCAKRLKLLKEIVKRGGRWEIVKLSAEVVEASDDHALLQLARTAK